MILVGRSKQAKHRWQCSELLGAMPVKALVESGKICNQTTMRKRLERFCEIWIVDKTDGFRLNFIEKEERRFKIRVDYVAKRGKVMSG